MSGPGRAELRRALEAVEGLYSQNLGAHGTSAKSVGWRDAQQQRLRFEKLAQVVDRESSAPITVNDWGCGYGAMFTYLDEVLGPRLSRYRGYDISEDMIRAARQTVKDRRAEFVQDDHVAHVADYTFVSGTFNVRLSASEEIWAEHARDTVLRLYERSKEALSFNMLSTYVDWRAADLFYADPGEWFDFCKRELSRYVTLIHDYPLYEWTMLVRREADDPCAGASSA